MVLGVIYFFLKLRLVNSSSFARVEPHFFIRNPRVYVQIQTYINTFLNLMKFESLMKFNICLCHPEGNSFIANRHSSPYYYAITMNTVTVSIFGCILLITRKKKFYKQLGMSVPIYKSHIVSH